jgi:hypothetical protein
VRESKNETEKWAKKSNKANNVATRVRQRKRERARQRARARGRARARERRVVAAVACCCYPTWSPSGISWMKGEEEEVEEGRRAQ